MQSIYLQLLVIVELTHNANMSSMLPWSLKLAVDDLVALLKHQQPHLLEIECFSDSIRLFQCIYFYRRLAVSVPCALLLCRCFFEHNYIFCHVFIVIEIFY